MKITNITLAGFSDVVYHSTSIDKLQDILKENKISMSSNLGTRADQLYKKKKFRPYYFSMSRVKFGGFARTIAPDWLVTLVMDGAALKQKYYGQSVDYWGEDWRKSADQNDKIAGNHETRLKYNENEERIYSDKPFIEPINKYVKEIHINLATLNVKSQNREKLTDDEQNKVYEMSRRYREILPSAKALRIPVYLYSDYKDFQLMAKSKASKGYEIRSSYIDSLNELFRINSKEEDKLDSDTRELLFRVIYTGSWRDVKSTIECDIHNSKSGNNRAEKTAINELVGYMRKNKLSDLDGIQKFLSSKFEYLK